MSGCEEEVYTQEEKCMLCEGHHDRNGHDAESNEEFDFGSPAEEAEGSMEKDKTWKWSDVVRGLKPKIELEDTDSDKSWNESETTNSEQQTDPDESDQ